MKALRCSQLDRVFLCHGSHVAEQSITKADRERIAAARDAGGAQRGTDLHAETRLAIVHYMKHNELPEGLPWEVRFCAEFAKPYIDDAKGVYTEIPLAWTILNGHADLITVKDDCVDVIDYKMGFNPTAAAADGNLQLGGYAVLAWKKFEITPVFVHLLCPNEDPANRVTSAEYTAPLLEQYQQFITDLWPAATKDGAKREPSALACKWCDAKGTAACPESCKMLETFGALNKKVVDVVAMPNDDLLAYMDKASAVKAVADAILAEGKHRLQDGTLETDHWKLKEGARSRKFATTFAVWNTVKERLGDDKTARTRLFLDACKVSFPGLLKAYRAQHPEVKSAQAEQELTEILADVMTVSRRSPSLTRVMK